MEFLDQIPLDQTALTIAMVAIVLLFAVVSVIKGIIKTIITLISFAIAAAAFLFGFLQSPPYIKNFIPEAAGWMPLVAGAICALLAIVIIQIFLGVFSGKSKKTKKPSGGENSDSKSKKGRNPLAPLFGLFVGILALYGAITALRYFGTNAELQYLQTYVSEGAETAGDLPLIVQAKQWLDKSPIATWQERIDVLNTADYRSRLNLAKLIIVSGDRTDLAKAVESNDIREALQVPEINSVTLTGDDLRKLCEDYDFQALFKDDKFKRLTTRPSTRRELIKLKWDQFLETGAESKKKP